LVFVTVWGFSAIICTAISPKMPIDIKAARGALQQGPPHPFRNATLLVLDHHYYVQTVSCYSGVTVLGLAVGD
jgi:hypothetical protein